jgi:hypothetical protein
MTLATTERPQTRKQADVTKKKMDAKGKPQNVRPVGTKAMKPKPSRRLARKDIHKPEDTNETHADIQRALAKAKGSSALKGVLGLNRKSIVVAERVFQWRLLDTDVANREEHILGMATAIADSGKPLDAILVLPVGGKFYVIDGHHRLAAYDTAKWSRDIPARAFGGTLNQARLEALRLNSRNKLSMTKEDKQEAAWKLVKLQDGSSKEQIHEWTTVSTSNVGNMRRVLKKLQGLERGEDAIPIADLTWRRALREDWATVEGGKEWEADEWKEREANKIVEALMKANIGFMLKKQPEITAMALERLDGNLAEALMAEWLHRPENEGFIVALIKDHLDAEAASAWVVSNEPKVF